MFPSNPLIADLPLMLQVELNRALLPDETLLVCLGGSQGEAFALTSRRAIIIRDKGDSVQSKCLTYTYPLNDIRSARAVTHQTGGYLELDLANATSDPESRKVTYPLDKTPLFEAASAKVNEVIAAPKASVTPPSPVSTAPVSASACPDCGAALGPNSVFCSACGRQMRAVCADCGSSTPLGSAFCSVCGKKLTQAVVKCPGCGEARSPGTTYCTSCGTILRQQCLVCGAAVVDGWKHCGFCGRMLGSDRVDPHGSQAAQRRLREIRDIHEASQESGNPPDAPKPTEPAPTKTAETHNAHGLELLESEDYDGAIAEFRQAVALEPNNASYRYNLAVAFDEADRDDEALGEYQSALQLDPHDTGTLLALGYMYSENDDSDKAILMWKRVIEVAPGSADAQEADNNIRNQGSL